MGEAVSDKYAIGRSLPSCPITEAMLEAGASVLSENAIDLAEGFVSSSEVAEAVFLAMLTASAARSCP